ncbi:MAG: TonB-dependent receptor [Flavobacteriales bacterium]|nr:TonB-dependent receptor [Flavobacteriales bacterium]
MLKGIISLLLVALSAQLFAQDKIEILDAESGLAIDRVQVVIYKDGGFKALQSDVNGQVKLPDKEFDSLHFIHPAYLDKRIDREKSSESWWVVYLEPAVSQLPDFVFKGYSKKKTPNAGPAKIERITQRDVNLYAPQTSADLLGINDHVFIQKSQLGGGSPMIRGFSANSVLLVVDGVRINNAIFREGNLHNVILIDPNLVVETDLLFGPGSVIHGSDALGGVFAFQTRKPALSDQANKMLYKGNLVLKGSSANRENSWHVDFNIGKDKWASLSSISISNFNDLRMGAYGPDFYLRPEFVETRGFTDTVITNPDPRIQYFTAYSQINLAQKFRFRPDSLTLIDFQTTYTTSSPVPRYDRLTQYRNGIPRYATWQYGPQNWLFNALNYKRTLHHKLASEFELKASWQNIQESREERRFGDLEFQRRTENVQFFNVNLEFEKDLPKGVLFYGIEQIWNLVKSKGLATILDSNISFPISSRYPDGSTWGSSAAYLMLKSQVSRKVQFTGGLRYTHVYLEAPFENSAYSFYFDNLRLEKGAFNASAGLDVQTGRQSNLSLHLATGFRAPNIDDIGKIFDSEPGKVVVPNSDLQPEYVYSADLGYRGRIGSSFRLQANVFVNYLEKVITRGNFSLNGADSLNYNGELLQIQSLINNESGLIYGIELNGRYLFNPRWQAEGALNYMQGETSEGIPFRHVTPLFGKLAVNYVQSQLKLTLYGLVQGELSYDELAPSEQNKPDLYLPDANGLPYAPSWWTLNLKGTYSMSKSLHLSSGIENILNKRYRPYSSGITAPGLNFYFGIRTAF